MPKPKLATFDSVCNECGGKIHQGKDHVIKMAGTYIHYECL